MIRQVGLIARVFITLAVVVGIFSINDATKFFFSNQLLLSGLIVNPYFQFDNTRMEVNSSLPLEDIQFQPALNLNTLPDEEIVLEAKRFALYSGISYCPVANLVEWSCILCSKIGSNTQFIEEAIYEPLDLRVIVVVDKLKEEIVLSFRGSNGIYQALGLIGFSQVTYNGNPEFKIQEKFSQKTLAVLPGAKRILAPLLKSEYKHYRLVVVGHSLGGAIAVLAAPLLKEHFNLNYKNMAVYTYGQPRVGNLAFAKWYASLPMPVIRTVNGRDAVPHTPFGTNYVHINRELYLTENHKLCAFDIHEDPTCSSPLFPVPFLSVHGKVWDIDLGAGSC